MDIINVKYATLGEKPINEDLDSDKEAVDRYLEALNEVKYANKHSPLIIKPTSVSKETEGQK